MSTWARKGTNRVFTQAKDKEIFNKSAVGKWVDRGSNKPKSYLKVPKRNDSELDTVRKPVTKWSKSEIVSRQKPVASRNAPPRQRSSPDSKIRNFDSRWEKEKPNDLYFKIANDISSRTKVNVTPQKVKDPNAPPVVKDAAYYRRYPRRKLSAKEKLEPIDMAVKHGKFTTRQARSFKARRQLTMAELLHKVAKSKDFPNLSRLIARRMKEYNSFNLGSALQCLSNLSVELEMPVDEKVALTLLHEIHVKIGDFDAFGLSNVLLSMTKLKVDLAPDVEDDFKYAIIDKASKFNAHDICNALRGAVEMRIQLPKLALQQFEQNFIRDIEKTTSYGFCKIIWAFARQDYQLNPETIETIQHRITVINKRIPSEESHDFLYACNKLCIEIDEYSLSFLNTKSEEAKKRYLEKKEKLRLGNVAKDLELQEAKKAREALEFTSDEEITDDDSSNVPQAFAEVNLEKFVVEKDETNVSDFAKYLSTRQESP